MIRESKRLLEELFLYEREGYHEVRYNTHGSHHVLNHKNKELYYWKVEYLRRRLSDLGLDVDGTREMLEERLKPHLDIKDRHLLPTKLTKLLSENDNRLEQYHQKENVEEKTSSE